jgi:hypothetical protein
MRMNKLNFLLLTVLLIACSDQGMSPEDREFNLRFRYGVTAKNDLNTFRNSYTKDLILDGTATVSLRLSDVELDQIKKKMLEIDFFSYPDTFVAVPIGPGVGLFTPHMTYEFEVKSNTSIKRLHWDDQIVENDSRTISLRELIVLIRNIIESRPEYRQLPSARGGYI